MLLNIPRNKYSRYYRQILWTIIIICLIYVIILFNSYRYLWTSTNWTKHLINSDILTVQGPDLIPKVFHHTWKDEIIPSRWHQSYENCKSLYPTWEFRLWTDNSSFQFINTTHPSFIKTFINYPYPIQRADAIRYFVLYEYGGIYLDLDVGCSNENRMDRLLKYNAVLPKTYPIGFSNDMMASIPYHPFFKQLIDNLGAWNHNLVFPYATIFFSTGPTFLSIQFGNYNQIGSAPVFVLMPDLYSEGPAKLFIHHEGSTWHSWDAYVFKKIWKMLPRCLIVLVILILYKYYANTRLDKYKLPK